MTSTVITQAAASSLTEETINTALIVTREEYAKKESDLPILLSMHESLEGLKEVLAAFRENRAKLNTELFGIMPIVIEHVTVNEYPRLDQLRSYIPCLPKAAQDACRYYTDTIQQLVEGGLLSQYRDNYSEFSNRLDELYTIKENLARHMETLKSLFDKHAEKTSPRLHSTDLYLRDLNTTYSILNSTYCHLEQYFDCRARIKVNETDIQNTQNSLDTRTARYNDHRLNTTLAMQEYAEQIKNLEKQLKELTEQQAKSRAAPQGAAVSPEKKFFTSSATSSITPSWLDLATGRKETTLEKETRTVLANTITAFDLAVSTHPKKTKLEEDTRRLIDNTLEALNLEPARKSHIPG